MSETKRFSLPFILTSQSQKEVTHNEALTRLDLLLHLHVESDVLSDPPLSPDDGAAWIVAHGGRGPWAGRDAMIAQWLDGQWRYIEPQKGMRAWIASREVEALYDGVTWQVGMLRGDAVFIGGEKVIGMRGGAIPDPSGGQVIDVEARLTLAAILTVMRQHGLIVA